MANNGIRPLSCVDTFHPMDCVCTYECESNIKEKKQQRKKKTNCNASDECERPKCEQIKEIWL